MDTQNISIEVHLNQPYEQALESVTTALKTEGFGVLTRIDVRATLKEKLGVEFRPYAILGACNPPLAHRAISNDPETGLILPCNVTVEALSEDQSIIRIADPQALLAVGNLADNETLRQVSHEAQTKLKRVADALAQSAQ